MQLAAIKRTSIELLINGVSQGYEDVLTMDGLESIASFIGTPQQQTTAWMPYIVLGSGDTGPGTESKYLETEQKRQAAVISRDGITYIAKATFNIAAAFVLREVGLISKSAGGKLAAHWSLTSDISLAVGDQVNVTCKIYIA